jgi:phosphatidylserine/phosphatidylglycerophosphate/cardiolipin synthase-like enzyme
MPTLANNPRKHLFPWRKGNNFQLLINGSSFFPAMINAINHAEKYILFEMYLFESGQVSDRFISALINASENGISVNLLLDDYGAMNLNKNDREKLDNAKINLVFYNRLQYLKFRGNLLRDHRKVLIIDGVNAFIGGAGITDDFDDSISPAKFWRDTMIEISGPNVIDWQKLFLRNWKRWTSIQLPLNTTSLNKHSGQYGRVAVTRTPIQTEGESDLIYQVQSAHQRVWLATAYFVPSGRLHKALFSSAKKGVDVRLMLPGSYTDHPWVRRIGQHRYGNLLRNGIRIFEYQPHFLHTKIYLCDEWVILGSSNMDRWNLRWNLEADQEIDNPDFANATAAMFNDDFTNCVEITYENWRNRPLLSKFKAWFWSKVSILLEYISS